MVKDWVSVTNLMNPIMGYMLICYVCALYRCSKLIIVNSTSACFIHITCQVSTLTCITMDHNCELLMCYVVVNSGM